MVLSFSNVWSLHNYHKNDGSWRCWGKKLGKLTIQVPMPSGVSANAIKGSADHEWDIIFSLAVTDFEHYFVD